MLNTLLLAAGKGLRITDFSKGLPKPLMPIAGDAILFRNLRWLNSFSFINSVWINLHYRHTFMKREIKNFSHDIPRLKLQFIYEKNILGTAGALKNLLSCHPKKGHNLIIYGDNLFNFDLSDFIETHFDNKNIATIALFDQRKQIHTRIAGGKVSINDNLEIESFIEGRECASLHYVNAGVYLLSPEITDSIPSGEFCDFGKDIFPKLLLAGIPLHGYIIDGYCLGLDAPECFAIADELIRQQKIILL